MTAPNVTFVLGGARSGKSLFAENKTAESGKEKIYVATAQAWDDEMRERIALHRSRRSADWTTVDAPMDLVGALKTHVRTTTIVLVDCLTLWLSNLITADHDLNAATEDLAGHLREKSGSIVLVSNEVGLGIVPENALARRFRDAQGRLNQQFAARAGRVAFVAAGLPLWLKGGS